MWRRVLAADPGHAAALHSLAVHAFRRRDFTEALRLLRSAQVAAPDDPMILLTTSVVLREQGNSEEEFKAIQASLVVDQYFLPGLLAKASFLERSGRAHAAVAVYRDVLKIVPDERQWPDALRTELLHAQGKTQEHARGLASFISERVGMRLAALTPAEAERWAEAGALVAGTSRPFVSQATRLQVPRIAAIPFFAREDFPWLVELESKTDAIRAEMHAALSLHSEQFKPYVAYAPGVPLNQWQELNNSKRWSSYFLWCNGQPVADHLQECPVTASALAAAEMPRIPGQCPNAMFSVLAAHTVIPPHHGETNARLVVHLPLVVPEGCTYRVGFEQRRWTVGEALVFDDSIEHEARNDGDQVRVVLILDTWNPLLSIAEREMVLAVSEAAEAFRQQT